MPTNLNGFVIFGAIEQKWLSIGGPHSPLPRPVSNEVPTFDGIGRRQAFEGGLISWHPKTGAFIVWGLIGVRWLEIGGEQFGYPITDETSTPDGRGKFNHFRAFRPDGSLLGESSIYWSPGTGAHEVYGGIRDFWAANGWERSKVGYPLNAEHDRTDIPGREQQFQHGTIIWSPNPAIGVAFATPILTLDAPGDLVTVTGIRFAPNSQVSIFYSYNYPGGFKTNGADNPLLATTDTNGYFTGVHFTLSADRPLTNIGVSATDNNQHQKAEAFLPNRY